MNPSPRLNWPLMLAAGIFLLCLAIGHSLSLRRPLWNDEIYSQFKVIDIHSYFDIILLRFKTVEGNLCPAFYLIQKGVSDLFGFKFPFPWEYEWAVSEPGSQVIMRLTPNVFMSLSIAGLFYFFARNYSWGAGVYALLTTLSSFMVWAYWVEARPYALWFFLTTVQLVLFLLLVKDKKENLLLWNWLAAVHIFLSLTLILSAIQIVLVSAVLWFFRERSLRKYLFLTAVPVGLCLFYYSVSVSMLYKYSISFPHQLILRNLPWERIFILGIYFIFLMSYVRPKKKETLPESGRMAVLLVLMIAAALSFLVMMSLRATPGSQHSSLSERYFMYLAPIGILAAVLFSVDLWRAFAGRRARAVLLTGLGALLLLRLTNTGREVFTGPASPFILSPGLVDAQAKLMTINHLIPGDFVYLLDFADQKAEFDEGKFEEYALYYKKIVEYMPYRADALGMWGYCLYQLNKPVQAVMAFQKAISLNPQFFEFHYNLGAIYFKLGQYRLAAESLRKAAAIKPQITLSYIMASREIYWPLLMNKEAGANPGYPLERQLAKTYRDGRILLIQSFLNLGDFPEALRYAEESIRSGGDEDRSVFYYYAGVALSGLKNYPESVRFLNQSIQMNPQSADGYYHLALALQAGGQDDLAARVLQQGKLISRTNPVPRPEAGIDLRIF